MNVSVGKHWEAFIAKLVESGRYGSASEVIRQGLRHVEADEKQLTSLREEIQAAIDEDVWFTADEVIEHIERKMKPEIEPSASTEPAFDEDQADFNPKI